MSRTKPTDFETRELQAECYTCSAGVDHWCVTSSGRWSTHLHSDRFYMAQIAKGSDQ